MTLEHISRSLLFSLILIVHSATGSDATPEPWLNGEKEYEGFPLRLRRPKHVDYDTLPPKLLVVVHHLAKTKPNGLPEPDYNHTLADFDHAVINYLPARNAGRVVLIETFGHKRSYYCYSLESVPVAQVRQHLEAEFPGFKLEFIERADPTAKFIRDYAAEHF